MFTKRTLFLCLVLLMGLAVFAPAQAQDATESAPFIAPQKCDQPGTLTMWVWDDNWAKIIQSSIDDWTAKYCPGATVNLVQQPWANYWDLVQTNAAGGDLPDVFNMSQDRFGFYATNGALLDLQPYWDKAGIDTTNWSRGEVDPYRYGKEGHLFAGPVNWDTIVIYYNKDMFDAAGLKYPTADWTWDDFADDAAKLTDAAKDQYGAAVYSQYQAGYANWIASTDTTPVVDAEHTQCTLTQPGSIEALNFLKDLYDKKDMPSISVMGGANADDSFNYWLAGHVAMVSNGSWNIPNAFDKAKFNWDVVQLPKNPRTGISRSIIHSVGYVASARTKNPDLAANLIQYLVSDEGQKFFADAGGVPPANPGLQQQWIDSFKSKDPDGKHDIKAFVDALADTQGVTPFGEIWGAMDTDLPTNIFDLNMSVADATQKACEAINAQLPK